MNDEVKDEQKTPATEPAPEAPAVEPENPTTENQTTEEVAPPEAAAKVIPHKDITSGMTIRLHERITDVNPKGEKRERIQVFEGIVVNVRGAQDSRTMTIRKMSGTVGVEKIFPLSSPNIAKIEVVKVAKTRRGNLSFIRGFRRKLKEVWMK